MDNNEFIKALNIFSQASYKSIKTLLINTDVNIVSMDFEVIPDNAFMEKYQIKNNIRFLISVDYKDSAQMIYLYNNIPIEPECFYIRPDNYTEVETLEILHKCIKLDTYNPNIKKLENVKNEC